MTDCDACGTTVSACNDGIRETGRECCPLCLIQDTHHMLEPQNSAALVKEMHEYTRHAAATILWRHDVGVELGKLIRRCELLEEYTNALQADNERLRDEVAGFRTRLNTKREEISAEVKRAMLAATLAEVAKTVHDLPERLGIIERALPEIEAKVGLRRRAKEFQIPKAISPPKEKQ